MNTFELHFGSNQVAGGAETVTRWALSSLPDHVDG